jgi:hypothetical protein
MFSALEKGAASLNHIAGIAEAEAEGLADIMAIEREEKIIMIRNQLAVTISEDPTLETKGLIAPVIATAWQTAYPRG